MFRFALPVLALLALGGCMSIPTDKAGGKVTPAVVKRCAVNKNPNHPQCSVQVEATLRGGSCVLSIDTDLLVLAGDSRERRVGFNLRSPGLNTTFDPAGAIKFYGSRNGAKVGGVLPFPPFSFTIASSGNRLELVPTASDRIEYAYSVHVVGTHQGRPVKCDSDPIIKNGEQ